MTKRRAAASILACFLLAAEAVAHAPDSPSSRLVGDVGSAYLDHLKAEDLSLKLKFGLPIERLPDISPGGEEKDAAIARGLLDRLAAVKMAELSHEETLSLDILRRQLQARIDGPRFYWLNFPVTPYASPFGAVNQAFKALPLKDAASADAYVVLLKQLPGFVEAIRSKVEGQADRGIRVSKDELDMVVPFIKSLSGDAATSPYMPAQERLAGLPADVATSLRERTAAVIDGELKAKLQTLADSLGGEYRAKAPDAVGLGQYPDGPEYYAWLVKWHTTLDVTPKQVHDIGLARVAGIEAEMAKVREEIGFKGTASAFKESLRTNPRFFPRTPEEIGERLMSHMRRIEPRLDEYFLARPKAPYGVRRLAPELEPGQTFGYYNPPTAADAAGTYYFNGSKLQERSLLNAAALTFHELAPGHHFQIASTYENTAIPPFQRETYDGAYTEGWGEYSSLLAGEMGMYADPYDRYGRLSMEMFITVRLVVDTGMNAFGWSRTKATDYMKAREMETDTQIASESLRYSCDIPGQALAYKMGALKIVELREKARAALGAKFDIRRFHEAVLGNGSLPLSTLARHIDWFIAQERAAHNDRNGSSS